MLNPPICWGAERFISEGINFLACMLALYKEQSMLLALQRQHRKLSSFINGLILDAPSSLLKPDQLPVEKGLKNVSFSITKGSVKFLGGTGWTMQWAAAIWRKSANTKGKVFGIKGKVHHIKQSKGSGWCYREMQSLGKNQAASRGCSLRWGQIKLKKKIPSR